MCGSDQKKINQTLEEDVFQGYISGREHTSVCTLVNNIIYFSTFTPSMQRHKRLALEHKGMCHHSSGMVQFFPRGNQTHSVDVCA